MSITIDDGSRNTARITVYADTTSDISSVSTNYAPGSVIFVINEAKTYMLNNDKEWKEI